MSTAIAHGGALGAAIERFGGTRGDWLDLSTGINPAPPSLPALGAEVWARLPEREQEEALRDAARAFYGAPREASVVLAPGTQSLVSLWPHLFAPCEAAVVSPTYQEHEAGLREAGHRVRLVETPADLPADARLLVLVNPNNPDGRRFDRPQLLSLADQLHARGGLLVVDEAFMDVDLAESLAADTGRAGLLVLRSFGKVFGLAGVRLGFALTHPVLALRLERRLGPWAVSGPALAISTAFLGDAALAERLRDDVREQNRRLVRVLRDAGLAIEGGTPLFTLARHAKAGALFEALCRRHVLTRPFTQRGDWLRFGNPAGEGEARRLAFALQEALAEIGA